MHRQVHTTATEACLPVLDLVHLSRQTDGDLALQRELLGLFRQRSPELIVQMGASTPDLTYGNAVSDLIHQLKGSALAIGAFQLAAAAEAAEHVFARGADAGPNRQKSGEAALAALADMLAQTLALIDMHMATL